MAINSISVVSVPVSDQNRARDFFVNTLGFELLADTPMGDAGGPRWVQVAPGASETTLTLVTWFPTMPPGSLTGLVLECEDIAATYLELQGRGVQFNGPVEEQDWGTFATFQDPDGNSYVLSQQMAK